MAEIDYNEMMQSRISREKVHSRSLGETRYNLPRCPPPLESHKTSLILPEGFVIFYGKHMQNVIFYGSSLETQCVGLFLGVGHIVTLLVMCQNSRLPRKEGVQH